MGVLPEQSVIIMTIITLHLTLRVVQGEAPGSTPTAGGPITAHQAQQAGCSSCSCGCGRAQHLDLPYRAGVEPPLRHRRRHSAAGGLVAGWAAAARGDAGHHGRGGHVWRPGALQCRCCDGEAGTCHAVHSPPPHPPCDTAGSGGDGCGKRSCCPVCLTRQGEGLPTTAEPLWLGCFGVGGISREVASLGCVCSGSGVGLQGGRCRQEQGH